MDERDAYVALNMMERVGPVTVRNLVSVLGSAVGIFSAGRNQLMAAPKVGPELATAIVQQRDDLDWAAEMARAREMGVEIVTPLDEVYPAALAEIHDPPLALYVKGTLDGADARGVALVGTRRPTHYGRAVAEDLGFHLGKARVTVISGLATGIDTAGHRGALKAGGRTLAVLGGALDCLYPESNRELAREITGQGAVISEFPFGRKPDKTTFPMRNRVVSGMSMGVVVVEAGPRSGALITADQALDQGRTVFAVPGRIDSRMASGPHKLLRQGAKLVEGVDDILEEFDGLFDRSCHTSVAKPDPGLTEDERCLVAHLADGEQSVDALIRQTGVSPATINAVLMSLEIKKQIRMLPGRVVELVTR